MMPVPWRSGLITGLAVISAVLVAMVCGLVALFGAAAVIAAPSMFLGTGLVVFLVVNYAGAALVATHRAPPQRRRTVRRAIFASSSAVLVTTFSLTALVPPSTVAATAPRGQFLVDVSTGSQIAVVKLPARGEPQRPPIVVLHGGPGVPDLAGNARALAPLAARGDVYLYAQVGTDGSTRLSDPRGYGRDRDVADLDALRRRLGLDQVVLIGHSYGGALAAHYLAVHSDHVAALVLLSPAALDPSDRSGGLATERLTARQRLRLYAELLAPRGLLGYTLLQVNPAAAHAYLPDAEADSRNDAVVALSGPALHCPGEPPGPRAGGTGFYAMQYPQSASAAPPSDPRPALTGLPTPTLIIKGSCDYLSWSSATDYRDRLPGARLLYLPDAGHNVQQDQPSIVLSAIAAFLDQGSLPVAPYEQGVPPPDYLGPI